MAPLQLGSALCVLCGGPLHAGERILGFDEDLALASGDGMPGAGDRVHLRCFLAWDFRKSFVIRFNLRRHHDAAGRWTYLYPDGTCARFPAHQPQPDLPLYHDLLERSPPDRRFDPDPSSKTPCVRVIASGETDVYDVFSAFMMSGYRVTYPELLPRLRAAEAGDGVIFRAQGCELGPMGAAAMPGVERGARVQVEALAVMSEYRGMGIGGALLDAVEAWATAREASAIAVPFDARHPRATAFFARRGYVRSGHAEFTRPVSGRDDPTAER